MEKVIIDIVPIYLIFIIKKYDTTNNHLRNLTIGALGFGLLANFLISQCTCIVPFIVSGWYKQ